jgi:Spy/CpxP family protein refolding chaperone
MKASGFKTVALAIGLVAAIGLANNVFAGKGYGKGPGNYENSKRGWDCPRYGQRGGLDQEELAKLDAERDAFFAATSDLRREIRQKDLELRSEMAKKEIDGARAHALQKELSDLEAQLDQKRLDQRIKLRAAYPDWSGEPGRYHRRGQHRGWGKGPSGSCW